jgi:hypothetical protein
MKVFFQLELHAYSNIMVFFAQPKRETSNHAITEATPRKSVLELTKIFFSQFI